MDDVNMDVVRVLLMKIEDGDRRKFQAQSNDAQSGGGARDLRFRPESAFWPFFEKLFPNKRMEPRISQGVERQIEILSGTVLWHVGEEHRHEVLEVWPSTDARPNEVRIARVSSLGLSDLIQDDPHGGQSVFMLFQQYGGDTRLHFTTETSLRNDPWHQTIKGFAEHWLSSDLKSACIDIPSGERFPNG